LHIKDQLLVQPKGSPAYNHIDEFLERKATPLVVAGAFILLSMTMTYLFVLRGILVMYKDGQKEILFFLLLTILYFTLIIGPLGGSVRFKVPITPFYLIIAAVGMIKSFPRISLWSKRMKA